MEHLIFEADCPQEFKSAHFASSLKMDWGSDTELMDFVAPKTRWLGFDHNAMGPCRLSDYPANANFSESHLWNAQFRQSRSDFSNLSGQEIGRQVAAFFQSWFFFGLLESVVGKKIETSYFVRQDHLYTRNLHYCLQSKVFRIRADPTTQAQENEDIQLHLRLVYRWVDRFTVWSHPSFRPKVEADHQGLLNQLEDIVPAIVRLSEVIEQTRLLALSNQPSIGTLLWKLPFQAAEARRVRLGGLGWCPFQIRLLEDTVNHSTMDWIVASGVRQSPAGHEDCTESECARNNIDNSTYMQAHAHEDCRCEKLIPSVTDIVAILMRDEIPVVRFETVSGVGRLAVTAISKTQPGTFVAISHVWADGLGGATETGLNNCQVERVSGLCARVLKADECAWFWLDCLCIPREADKEVYYKALDGIKDVYRCASSVLVIDKAIQACSVNSSTEFLYAHIYLSAWMQRMWTYEEAVLSTELVFALGDGLHKYKVDTGPSMRRTVCVVWQCLASQLFRLRAGSRYLTIGHIHRALRYRLCNVPQDEFISVAGMLGLDTMTLLSLQGDERTKAFWLMLQWVPPSVVFLDGPKLSTLGFRWAPRTLMSPSQVSIDTAVSDSKAKCTANGLIGAYVAVQIHPELTGRARQPGSIFYVWVESSDESFETAGDHRGLLRLYCTENWPSSGATFNMIILSNAPGTVLKPGQMIDGAALHDQGHTIQNSEGTATPISNYVGRLLVERMKNEEIIVSEKTAMFEGRSRIRVDTQGSWSTRHVCIV